MFNANNFFFGINIRSIKSCDFSTMHSIENEDILKYGRDGNADVRLLEFITKKMKIKNRYWAKDGVDSLDLAKSALSKLIQSDPGLVTDAEFMIFAGISNPMPTVCQSAFLASELELQNTSCWDLKSGCSTGVLALMQALEWVNRGAKKGIIVCSETFSKFTNKETLQMAASIGDGAVAFVVEPAKDFKVLGAVHGTDARFMKSMYVPGKYPVDVKCYNPLEYTFNFSEKGGTSEMIAHYWKKSLEDLLRVSNISGREIHHYIAHQVDGSKNYQFAKEFDIPDEAIALNFEQFGNMGCPTIFLNYMQWMSTRKINSGDIIVYHAVGGGLSWAALAMQKV